MKKPLLFNKRPLKVDTISHYTLSGPLYVASDIHLGSHIPLTNQAFFSFLQEASQNAHALILVGDVFNVWFGDDVAFASQESWLQESLQALKACAKKIPIYFIHGNRDFLVGTQLCQTLGIQLMPEQVILNTDAGVVFISHGDELCTHDKAYMRLRKILRCSFLQKTFLSLPLKWRQNIAHFLRQRSKNAQKQHNADYHRNYDIDLEYLNTLLQQYPEIQYVIHGHTHKEAIHDIPLSSAARQRYVLSDWDMDNPHPRGGYLIINAQGLSLHPFRTNTNM